MQNLANYRLQALPVGESFAIVLYRSIGKGYPNLGEMVGIMNAEGNYRGLEKPSIQLANIISWFAAVVQLRMQNDG